MSSRNDTSVEWAAPEDGQPARVRVRGPGDLVASLPALVGFHPARSVVLLVLDGPRGRVRLTARVDLPAEDLPEQDLDLYWVALGRALATGAGRVDATHALLVCVDADTAVTRRAAEAVESALQMVDVPLVDALSVDRGRYRSVRCEDSMCCPPGGREVPSTSAAPATAVLAGQVIHARRSDLGAEIAPAQGSAAQRAERVMRLMAAAVSSGSIEVTPQSVRDRLDRACADAAEGRVSLDQAALLALLVSSHMGRDLTYQHLTTRPAGSHRALWAAVCRLLPREHLTVPLVMFGYAAYLEGDGAAANVAHEASEAIDPRHASVCLLGDVLAAAIRPRDVRDALLRSTASCG